MVSFLIDFVQQNFEVEEFEDDERGLLADIRALIVDMPFTSDSCLVKKGTRPQRIRTNSLAGLSVIADDGLKGGRRHVVVGVRDDEVDGRSLILKASPIAVCRIFGSSGRTWDKAKSS